MEISQLAWRLILLFTPGILCTAIVDSLVVHKPWKPFDFFIRSFIFGIITYFVLQFVFLLIASFVTLLFKWPFAVRYLDVWNTVSDEHFKIVLDEIAYASVTSIGVAFLASKIINDKWLIKLGHRTHTTTKFGDDSVWSYFLNSTDVEWVCVRDQKNDLAYQGWVQAFSDADDLREIVLQDVTVYRNSDASRLYELPAVYLSGKSSNFVIELVPVTVISQIQESN